MFATIILVGRLAQWLERCVDIAEVTGSSPVLPICKVSRTITLFINFKLLLYSYMAEDCETYAMQPRSLLKMCCGNGSGSY